VSAKCGLLAIMSLTILSAASKSPPVRTRLRISKRLVCILRGLINASGSGSGSASVFSKRFFSSGTTHTWSCWRINKVSSLSESKRVPSSTDLAGMIMSGRVCALPSASSSIGRPSMSRYR